MATIIDKRRKQKYKSAHNRKRFMERYKDALKKQVEKTASRKSLKKLGKKNKIKIAGKDTREPSFRKDYETGDKTRVLPGNRKYQKGDQIKKPPKGGKGEGSGPDSSTGDDDFIFALSREEFFEIYFKDMSLPNYIKKACFRDMEHKMERAGYTKIGIPARLDIKKTFEQAVARKFATRAAGKKPRYLDDIDIRYRLYAPKPIPVKQAVMFCLMDVSGSMTVDKKELAKRFFLLLYLFLQKEYENVELVFIRHTHEAEEVDENTFFYDAQTGGTVVSTALHLMTNIIEARYPAAQWNIYGCQCTDGDNWSYDNGETREVLIDKVLPLCQYYAYIQTMEKGERISRTGLYALYEQISENIKHLNISLVYEPEDVYLALKELFKGD